MPITLKDFHAFTQERMSEAIARPEQFLNKAKEIFDFAVANESSMDAEANAYFNNFVDTLAQVYELALNGAADRPPAQSRSDAMTSNV